VLNKHHKSHCSHSGEAWRSAESQAKTPNTPLTHRGGDGSILEKSAEGAAMAAKGCDRIMTSPTCPCALVRALPAAGSNGGGTCAEIHPGPEIRDAAAGVQNREDGDGAREVPGEDQGVARSAN